METMSAQYKAKTNKTGSRSVMTHRWHWRKWLPERHSQLCRVLATGRMNSALVEFEDGTKVVTSRYAVRKLTHNALAQADAACGVSPGAMGSAAG